MTALVWIASIFAILFGALGLALAIYLIRLRRITARVGSFQCAYRATLQSGWNAGTAVYGVERLDWYRLVSLSSKPTLSWSRYDMNLDSPIKRGGWGDESVVEVWIWADGRKFELAMSQSDHSGLVSWSEASPPTPRDFY